jgi:hypothetical protein
MERRRSLTTPKSVGGVCREAEVWRAIPRWPCDDLEERQREKGADAGGYLKAASSCSRG